MASIVIAAHNEAQVIGRCLDVLLADAASGEFDVTVVANGCTDATAQAASMRAGVRVLDLATPGKVGALNAGDEVAVGFPRIYLDADVFIPTAGIRALCAALADSSDASTPRVLASTARRVVDVSRSPLLVRAYFSINSRLPAFRNALFGRGVIALSAEGRSRFGRFPDVLADDMFVNSLFAPAEKREIESAITTVVAPGKTRDLIRRLARVRRANAGIRALQQANTDPQANRDPQTAPGRLFGMSWLFEVVLRKPTLVLAAPVYVGITIAAAIMARRQQRANVAWERDESSRQSNNQVNGGEMAGAQG